MVKLDLRFLQDKNRLIGGFILFLFISLAGGEIIYRTTSVIPGVDESFPCSWLPSPDDLANHQSLVGRRAATVGQPIQLRVLSNRIPPVGSNRSFVVSILVVNRSLGTIPMVYDPDEVIVGDNNTSGLGIIFSTGSNLFVPGATTRVDEASYTDDRLRVLGPKQSCIHKLLFSADQIDASLRTGNATVRAYYRGNNAGTISPLPPPNPTPIYTDQGLWQGVIYSPEIAIGVDS